MTQFKGEVELQRGKHRLVEPFFLLSVICGSISSALAFKATGKADYAVECGFQSLQFDRYVVLPMLDPVGELLAKNEIPDRIKFRLDEQPAPRGGATGETPLGKVLDKIIAPFFLEFHDKHLSWVRSKYGQSYKGWPTIWQFARLVRNAAAHDGALEIDPASVPVSWHSLSYGPANNGQRIFGADLALADIFILMLELSDALDKGGCLE
jgi:hypothetical protein